MVPDPEGTGGFLPAPPEQDMNAPAVATQSVDSTVDLETNKAQMPKGGEI